MIRAESFGFFWGEDSSIKKEGGLIIYLGPLESQTCPLKDPLNLNHVHKTKSRVSQTC